MNAFIVITLIKTAVVFAVLMTTLAYLQWVERKVIAHIQSRLGPSRVGPHGLLQPLADVIKLITKEDLLPPQEKWGGLQSISGLHAPVGFTDGVPAHVTLADASPHALIGGPSGSGSRRGGGLVPLTSLVSVGPPTGIGLGTSSPLARAMLSGVLLAAPTNNTGCSWGSSNAGGGGAAGTLLGAAGRSKVTVADNGGETLGESTA